MKPKLKSTTCAVVLALGVVCAAPTQALDQTSTSLDFTDAVNKTNLDASGFQSTSTIDVFDWEPGNALADGSIPLSEDPAAPTTFDLYYQARLGTTIAEVPVMLNTADNGALGLTGFEITVVMGMTEDGSRTDTDANGNGLPDSSVANFTLSATQNVNFFEMYIDYSPDSNNLEGTGFDDGTLIMGGSIIAGDGTFTVSIEDPAAPGTIGLSPLDNFGSDDRAGVGTLSGTGTVPGADPFNANILVDVSFLNSTYFDPVTSGFLVEMLLSSTTDLQTPYDNVDPSKLFFDGTNTFSPTLGTCPPGSTFTQCNGLQNATAGVGDFQFESDGRSVMSVTTRVPEPGILSLMGAGLLAGAGFRRRRIKGKA